MRRADTMDGGGTGDMWNILEEAGHIKILKPNQMQIDIPEIEGVIISNIGFIDRKLHIQTKWETNDKDRHGYFYLADKEGEKIEIKENNFCFGVDENDKIQFGSEYIEYILEISKEQVKDTQLMGYFAEDGEGTEIEKIKCHIKLKSGEVEQFDSVSTSNQSGDIIMKFTSQVPLMSSYLRYSK